MLEYVIIFLLLALIGYGLPVPEEGVLLVAAYYAAIGDSGWLLVLFSVLGIALSDTIRYIRGRMKSKLFTKFKVGHKFITNTGFFAVFISRFFITSRTIMPYMAGSMQMPRVPFHFASILSAIVSCSVIIIGGSWFYSMLAQWTANAVVIWFALVIFVTGALIMSGTRSQLQLMKE
jgi:membrane protein DedA with SNARE-associated domain